MVRGTYDNRMEGLSESCCRMAMRQGSSCHANEATIISASRCLPATLAPHASPDCTCLWSHSRRWTGGEGCPERGHWCPPRSAHPTPPQLARRPIPTRQWALLDEMIPRHLHIATTFADVVPSCTSRTCSRRPPHSSHDTAGLDLTPCSQNHAHPVKKFAFAPPRTNPGRAHHRVVVCISSSARHTPSPPRLQYTPASLIRTRLPNDDDESRYKTVKKSWAGLN